MEWPKLKNIIILILLLLNGFLLVLVGMRYTESVQYERAALEQTLKVLEGQGIQADGAALAPAGELAPLTAERDLERELQLAQALLGQDTQAENRGGGLYLYRGVGGPGGRAGAADQRSGASRRRPPAGHGNPGGADRRHPGGRVDPGAVPAELGRRAPVLLRGAVRLPGRTPANRPGHPAGRPGRGDGGVMALPTALMRFSEEIAATGDVCSAIQSMEPGWRGTVQPLSGGVRLSPAWLVTTDTAQYYLDCATGALTRITDQ